MYPLRWLVLVPAFGARLGSVSGPARPPYPGRALPAMAAPDPPPQPEGSRSLSALLSGIAQAAFHGNAGITEELLRAQLYPEAPPEEFRALRAKMGGLLQVPAEGKGPRTEGSRSIGLSPPGARGALPSPALPAGTPSVRHLQPRAGTAQEPREWPGAVSGGLGWILG